MEKQYLICITSGAETRNSFTTHIFPNGNTGGMVRSAVFEDVEALKTVLNRCLPKSFDIEKIILMAQETGICDLRVTSIPLSDECATHFGWIF